MQLKRRLVSLGLLSLGCMAAQIAHARDSYGYIFGLGTSTGNVSSITIYDNTTHVFEGNPRGVQWGGLYGVPQGLRWYGNGLSPGHSYTVTIYPNGFEDRAKSMTATISSGWTDYKWADMTFTGIFLTASASAPVVGSIFATTATLIGIPTAG